MKKFIALLLSFVIAVSALAGCSSTSDEDEITTAAETAAAEEEEETEETTAAEVSDTHEVIDKNGDSITVPTPENLNGYIITTFQGALEASVLLGVTDYVKGMAYSGRYYAMQNLLWPEVYDLPDYGSFNDLSFEEILASDVDVVISMYSCTEANEKLAELGITVVCDGNGTDDYLDTENWYNTELDVVAQLTGTEDKLEEYYEWVDASFAIIEERVGSLTDEEKVTVMPMRQDITQVFGSNYYCGHAVELAGGINVGATANEDTGMIYGECDAEQLLEWNPDYIFQYNFGGEPTEETLASYTTWAEDAVYSNITAIQNGDVYMIPAVITSWTASIEYPLGIMWMSQIMYPELWEDFDLKAYANDFYEQFLGYTLDDDAWQIAAWQFDGANANGLSAER